MSHYHIRWGTGALDWERHETRAAAEKSARQLAQLDETYTIEEFRNEKCSACESGPCAKKQAAG